jgi:hypothetical protein
MKTRALGFLLMAIGACTYAVGCGSSNNNPSGTGGAAGAGTGGKATGGVSGTGGVAGAGAGGKMDSGTDTGTDTKTDTGADTKADAGTDTSADTNTDVPMGDTSGDTQAAPTFTQVYAILSDTSADTAPNCSSCHDGIIPDGGSATALPHSMDFSTKAAAYTALFGVNSLRCAGGDGGVVDAGAFKRVLAGDAAMSVLWQKVNQFVNTTELACDGVQMPLQRLVPADGGADAGLVPGTHHAITAQQVATIQGWINAGAPNN